MTSPVPLHAPDRQPDDPDAALRPKSLAACIGQEAALQDLGSNLGGAAREVAADLSELDQNAGEAEVIRGALRQTSRL